MAWLVITGNLTKDFTVHPPEEGKVPFGYGSVAENYNESTVYSDFKVFGSHVESFKDLKGGHFVKLEGFPKIETFSTKDGEQKYKLVLIAQKVTPLEKKATD